MRTGQRQLMREYLNELNTEHEANKQEDKLLNIIKTEQRTGINIIQTILIIALICFLAIAQIQGMYARQNTEIIEVCDGKPTNQSYQFILNPQGQPIDILKDGKSMYGKVQTQNDT